MKISYKKRATMMGLSAILFAVVAFNRGTYYHYAIAILFGGAAIRFWKKSREEF